MGYLNSKKDWNTKRKNRMYKKQGPRFLIGALVVAGEINYLICPRTIPPGLAVLCAFT